MESQTLTLRVRNL